MPAATRKLIRSLGCELTYDLIETTQRHLADGIARQPADALIERDLAYGPDGRHRLDIFRQADARDAPVLLFAHGGGFVMGDKRLPNLPFHDNIGRWAAGAGWIGATMNYRLAPDHMWPSGGEDIARAVAWLKAEVSAYGGNPRRIVLMGHSAGATHVATYLARPQEQPASGPGVIGAVLVSGVYDPAAGAPNAYQLAYYGTDRKRYAEFSTVPGLVKTNVPLCLAICEYDAIDFRRQAATLVGTFGRARGDMPRIHWLAGHNHLSAPLSIGTAYDALGPLVRDFVRGLMPDSVQEAFGRTA